ncbi:MAG TPA: PDZ domain-containing protein [Longimicrobium sp.]|nr:PDZ domain-containing protein [Longimicrobium sp.]
MRRIVALATAAVVWAHAARAHPAGTPWQHVDYLLSVDSSELSGFTVEMRVYGGPDTLRLAMAAHPEYDDRFWRYVRDVRVGWPGPTSVTREDSAVWRVVAPPGAPIRYRIQLPPGRAGARGSWQPFLTPTGGLVGGPHSLMYVLGLENVRHRLSIRLPRGWVAATGMERTSIHGSYSTRGFAEMMDSPLLVGNLRRWWFPVDRAAHLAAYWQRPGTPPVDSAALLGPVQAIVREARAVFGGLPYERYSFLLQDSAYGGLEHATSVSIGAPAGELADDPSDVYLDIAHEYFHAWNLVRLRPAGWGALSLRPPARTRELWWSEGVTMYFAEQILRRARLPGGTRPRTETLREDLDRYLDDPGFAHVSPEQGSWTTDDPPGANGEYQADHYLQGELIATALDLIVRDSTHGARGMDEVMREMYARHAGPRGFTGADVERTASAVCGCNLHGFFGRHVRGTQRIDFAPLLATLGLRLETAEATAADSAGKPSPDLRVWAYVPRDQTTPRFIVNDPRSAWSRAGLRTNDRIVSIKGATMPDVRAFRVALRPLAVGDSVRVEYERGGVTRTAVVRITPYAVTRARITEIPNATPEQRQRRERWLAGR